LSRKGAPAELLNAWRERRFLMLTSPAVIAELRAVLQYPRIRKKYPLSNDDIEQTIMLLEHDALLVKGEANVAGSVPDDPKDEMFLACALDGTADVIVSGDHHLLDLESYRDIPIMTPRQFLDQLRQDLILDL
jgi:putative PIN family toxin of toxin-antitoxin system